MVGHTFRVQQIVDPAFDAPVERPAFGPDGPTVMPGPGHGNFHPALRGCKPFAHLTSSDGNCVVRGTAPFFGKDMQKIDVLVIVNAIGP